MKSTLELKKEVLRIDRKWTTIWLATIFAYVMIGVVLAFNGWNVASFGVILGTIFSVLFLINHKLDVGKQMKQIKRLEMLDKKIEKLTKLTISNEKN